MNEYILYTYKLRDRFYTAPLKQMLVCKLYFAKIKTKTSVYGRIETKLGNIVISFI